MRRWDTMLVRTVGALDLENVTMTGRQRHIGSNSAIHTDGEETNKSIIFLMPTASPCTSAPEYHFNLDHDELPMPPVNSSECPQLAQSLPGISSIPGYFSPMAVICYYYPSIQNYNGSVVNGKLEEQAIGDPIPLGTLGLDSLVEIAPGLYNSTTPCGFLCGFADPCVVDNVVYKNTGANFTDVPGGLTILANITGPKRCLYGFSYAWLPVFSHSTLPIIILATNNLTEHQSGICKTTANYTAMVCPRTWWLSGIYNGGNASVASVDAFMKRGFDSLGAQLRTMGEDWDGNKTVAIGTSYETAVCIQFRWEWLLYPLAVVLGTLILLLAIILSSGFMRRNREVVWKSSILPFLFYGLEDGERKGGTELESEGALKKRAKPLRVRLTSGDNGWRLHTS
ncbi:hypothetical protein SLS64_011121 [Diaporthe eres]|uniref:Uncharacterized protein n=1 Tax=Diaporthe eres TaxID=83184 RepID=A0ABR1NN91_DIAER